MSRMLVVFVLIGLAASSGCTPSADSTSSPGPSMTEAPRWEMPSSELMMPGTAAGTGQPADPRAIPIDRFKMTAPEGWERKPPVMGMIQAEFSVSPAQGDQQSGRMTVMQVGGSVEANIDRWKGQFSKADGSPIAGDAKVEKLSVAGMEVQLVDISGTYADSPGMMMGAPPVARPDYRMLAAIVPAPQGNYFLKFYGPKKTVTENEKAFRTMVQSLK